MTFLGGNTRLVKAKPSIAGQRFGLLTVQGKNKESTQLRNKRKIKLWECLCDCGKTVYLPRSSLVSKGQKSCGCLGKNRKGRVDNKRRPDNIQGRRFGNLVAIKMTEFREWNSAVWECLCDCGQTAYFNKKRLGLGYRLNCGDSTRHSFYLKQYPETPKELPTAAWGLIEKYLLFVNEKSDIKINAEIEDEKLNRLIRACWILFYRRQNGEEITELHERRYILKWLRFAPSAVKNSQIRRNCGKVYYPRNNLQIGKQMTKKQFVVDSNGNVSELDFKLSKIRKKRKIIIR